MATVMYRARLFKTNDIVRQRVVKISNVNISNTPKIVLKKCKKLLQSLIFFQPKISVYLVIKS